MRIVFMGTPDFAVEVLKRLAGSGEEIVLAVTQPDRVKGRGRTASPSPVKAEAEALGIPVFTPEKVRRPEAVERIREAASDLIVVAAFGQILPQELLDIPEDALEADSETVGGWTVETYGTFPDPGTVFQSSGLTVTVLQMDGRRVEKILVEKTPADKEGSAEDEKI